MISILHLVRTKSWKCIHYDIVDPNHGRWPTERLTKAINGDDRIDGLSD